MTNTGESNLEAAGVAQPDPITAQAPAAETGPDVSRPSESQTVDGTSTPPGTFTTLNPTGYAWRRGSCVYGAVGRAVRSLRAVHEFLNWLGVRGLMVTEAPPEPTEVPSTVAQRVVRESEGLVRRLLGPVHLWGPAAVLTLTVALAGRAIQDYEISYGNAIEFKHGCPLEGRRTQTGSFVKLFAVTVTTVGVQGHLGSLQGRRSWDWHLLRVVEVLLAPLAGLFNFSVPSTLN